ncbi:MAG: hypothetical protein H0V66_15620, partial [Bdellovibrionales bacterium]|nr:hypothetical protein [Bdellovibrionales bacterium]
MNLVILLIVLFAGTLLSFQSRELFIIYSGSYLVSVLVLWSYNYGEDFFHSFQKQLAEAKEKKLLVAGQEIASNVESDKQEDRFLSIFEPKRVVKRKLINGLFLFFSYWLIFYKPDVGVSLNTLIPLVSCFFIFNSYFIGHLLAVLILNALLVLLNFSPEISFVWYFLYTFLSLSSLLIFYKFKTPFSRQNMTAVLFLSSLFV